MGLGLGISVDWASLVPYYARVASAFKARVEADGGTVESMSCLKADLKVLTGELAPDLLLNDYDGAAAAYSLRLLDKSYSGSAVRVRRASDNAEQDIAFSNNELDTATLETFASGTDAFVTTWYDQSGNGNDAAQGTASSQPKIVSSGSTILENGKAAVEFDGSGDELILGSSLGDVESTTFLTMKSFNTAESIPYARGQYYTITMNPSVNSFEFRDFVNNAFQSADATALSQFVSSLYRGANSASLQIAIDGTIQSDTGDNGRVSFGSGSIGSGSGIWHWNGRVQEIIEYNSNESTNRTGIETNINDYYSIYP